MGKIFGTDGVRGIAISDLSVDLAMKIGKAVSHVLAPSGGKIFIGKDTRISSSSLECALAAGITSSGVDAILLGVVPTPAVSFLTKNNFSNAGIMISASHNSFEFNGIKIFNHEGYKISTEIQDKIEDVIISESYNNENIVYSKIGSVKEQKYLVSQYVVSLKKNLRNINLRVLFDCANGASCACASKVFKNMNNVNYINNCPNGININDKCGSTYLMPLSHAVISGGFDLGIAYDGDADRCLAIDETGELIDGDHIIGAIALDFKRNGILFNNNVVGTIMSNMGLSDFCNESDINFIRTPVGDRFVSEKMRSVGSSIGGEQSGHVIFSDYSNTGDGILTSVMIINLVSKIGKSSLITKMFKSYPQFTRNLKIDKNNDFSESDEFKEFIRESESSLANEGRIIVRKSGTEPVIRITCEAKSVDLLKEIENNISRFDVNTKIGV